METTNKVPIKLVEDLKHLELIHPKTQIKDSLSQLKLPDLALRPIEPPEPVVTSSLDPNKQMINSKRDLLNKDDLQLGTNIIDPKKKYLMKK